MKYVVVSNTYFGLPEESASYKKQKSLKGYAKLFKENGSLEVLCRFNVVGVVLNERQNIIACNITKDVF